MEKCKIVWCSRHEMSKSQKVDLAEMLDINVEELNITTRNITWSASTDMFHDMAYNKSVWEELKEFDTITGVFPPVALECRPNNVLYCAISKQEKSIRKDGSAKVEFVHVRWTGI